jgi:GntR family transcriptional repressor for pyruvate dehydrogenase complex
VFDRLKVPKASDIVIDKIKEEIAEGRLKTGMRLPSERDLASQLGVSRPVVREALRMLQFMGIVQMKPGTSGALVLDGNIDVLSDSLTLVLDLKHLSHKEVYAVRRALEPLAAELAATHRGTEHLRRLAQVVEGMRSGLYQGADFSAANALFHVTVAEASGSLLVYTMMKAISRLIFRNTEVYVQTESVRQLVCQALSVIYQAIADGEPQIARVRMEELLDQAISVIEGKGTPGLKPAP